MQPQIVCEQPIAGCPKTNRRYVRWITRNRPKQLSRLNVKTSATSIDGRLLAQGRRRTPTAIGSTPDISAKPPKPLRRNTRGAGISMPLACRRVNCVHVDNFSARASEARAVGKAQAIVRRQRAGATSVVGRILQSHRTALCRQGPGAILRIVR